MASGQKKREWVDTHEGERPYVLLEARDLPARTHLHQICDWSDWREIVRDILDSSTPALALDFETRGTEPWVESSRVVGVGLSWNRGTVYLPVPEEESGRDGELAELLRAISGTSLVAHNVQFDGQWYYWLTREHPSWLHCTYGLYRQLATEDFPGQRWGLKSAMEDLLLWEDTNEEELDSWLVANGHIRSRKKEWKAGHVWHTELERWCKPEKGEMWQAPTEILGRYCCLDADATYLLHQHVLLPALEHFPDLTNYHSCLFLGLAYRLIEQRERGIQLDVEGLRGQEEHLLSEMAAAESELRTHAVTGTLIRSWERLRYEEHLGKEPEKYRKQKKAGVEPPKYRKKKEPGEEPERLTKAGKVSQRWEAWRRRMDEYLAPPVISDNWKRWKAREEERKKLVVSGNWTRWEEKRARLERLDPAELTEAERRTYMFNLGSGDQLQYLLYEHLNDWTDGPDDGTIYLYREDGSRVLLDRTDTGGLPTGADALGQMGEVGTILLRYSSAEKELGYVRSYISLSDEEGVLRPGWRNPGTVTGRLAGSTPNLQQVPKSRGTLQNFVARPGYVWLQSDVTALEKVVLTELSRDPALLDIYGPDAPAGQDVYLYTGARLPVIGTAILAAGYSPSDPTPETTAAAKKLVKRERGIAKKLVLSSDYGAGPYKIWKDLRLQGVDVEVEQVEQMHAAFWETYAGVRTWENSLKREWRERGGYVMNGFGRPLPVWEKLKKDLVNRVCQSTGHDVQMLIIHHTHRLLTEAGIEHHGIVWDFHDEYILEIREEDAERALEIAGQAVYDVVNSELGGLIPFTGDPQIVSNLADAKIEE